MSWQRTDGSLLGGDASSRIGDLAAYFSSHAIPAVLDAYRHVPDLVGLRLLADDDGRVATAAGDGFAAGLELEELAGDLADRFDLDVLVGDVAVQDGVDVDTAGTDGDEAAGDEAASEESVGDAAGGDAAGDGSVGDDDANVDSADDDLAAVEPADDDLRAVTLTSAAPEQFPGIARRTGEPITAAPAGDLYVILTEPGGQVPGVYGWEVEALPVVQIVAHGASRTVIAQSDDLSTTTLAWDTARTVVPGVDSPSPEQLDLLAHISSDDDDAQLIASASPTADLDTVREALAADAEIGPALLLEALGAGTESADFLDGLLAADEVGGARMYEPASAIHVVDVGAANLVGAVADFERERPELARSLSGVKAVTGAAVLLIAARAPGSRWRGTGLVAGTLLIADAIGDLAVFEWLRRRRGTPRR